MNRRQMIGSAVGAADVTAAGFPTASAFAASASAGEKLKGNIRHSVSQ